MVLNSYTRTLDFIYIKNTLKLYLPKTNGNDGIDLGFYVKP